jgi:hypothetical protein
MRSQDKNLVHCVYSAATKTPINSTALESLLEEFRRKNAKADVTCDDSGLKRSFITAHPMSN